MAVVFNNNDYADNGEKVITDCKRIIDNDITGEWSLLYKAS